MSKKKDRARKAEKAEKAGKAEKPEMSGALIHLDERRIRELDRLWGDAATAKDLDAVVAFYATDGSLVWPDTPPARGTAQIRDNWKQMLKTIDGLKLEFLPETITISDDGTLATDYGTVRFEQKPNPYTTTVQLAKYLVVWKKQHDSWKVLYDSYNLNASA